MHTRKFFTLILTAAALAALAALALGGHSAMAADKHDHTPRHGGVVTEAGHMEIELVVKPDVVQLFLSDHGKPVKLDGIGAKITLLVGGVKSEAVLTQAADVLEARGAFNIAGAKAVVVITRPGKAPVTARFTLR